MKFSDIRWGEMKKLNPVYIFRELDWGLTSHRIAVKSVLFVVLFQIVMNFVVTPEFKEFLVLQILIAALSTSTLAWVLSVWAYYRTEREISTLKQTLLQQMGLEREDIEQIKELTPVVREILKEIDKESLMQLKDFVDAQRSKWDPGALGKSFK